MHETPDDLDRLQQLLDASYAAAALQCRQPTFPVKSTPRYGAEWEQFIDSGPVYARIEPARMFTYSMPAD